MTEPGTTPDTERPLTGRDRLRRSLVRPSRGQAVVAVLVGVLAFAAVTQARLASKDDAYAGLRPAELIQTLNGLQAASRTAERDVADLEKTRSRLQNSSQSRAAALAQARQELSTLGVLAGTVPASGPGIRITVQDPRGQLSLNHLLDGVEELRNAGVEAMEVNDRVRVVAQTSFEDQRGGISVDGTLLKPPYVIDAIGDPETLAGALDFSGGFIDDVDADGGSVEVATPRTVQVTVTRTPPAPRWARPVTGQ